MPNGLGCPVPLEGNEEFRLAQRIGILKLVAALSVGIDAFRRGLPHRCDQLRALILLPAARRIDDAEPAFLQSVVACENRHDLVASPEWRGRAANVVGNQELLP